MKQHIDEKLKLANDQINQFQLKNKEQLNQSVEKLSQLTLKNKQLQQTLLTQISENQDILKLLEELFTKFENCIINI